MRKNNIWNRRQTHSITKDHIHISMKERFMAQVFVVSSILCSTINLKHERKYLEVQVWYNAFALPRNSYILFMPSHHKNLLHIHLVAPMNLPYPVHQINLQIFDIQYFSWASWTSYSLCLSKRHNSWRPIYFWQKP